MELVKLLYIGLRFYHNYQKRYLFVMLQGFLFDFGASLSACLSGQAAPQSPEIKAGL